MRGHMAGSAPDAVRQTVPNPPSTVRDGRADVRQDPESAGGVEPRWAVVRAGSRRLDPLDGTTLAGGHGILPSWLRQDIRSLSTDVLASTSAESRPDRRRLRN